MITTVCVKHAARTRPCRDREVKANPHGPGPHTEIVLTTMSIQHMRHIQNVPNVLQAEGLDLQSWPQKEAR